MSWRIDWFTGLTEKACKRPGGSQGPRHQGVVRTICVVTAAHSKAKDRPMWLRVYVIEDGVKKGITWLGHVVFGKPICWRTTGAEWGPYSIVPLCLGSVAVMGCGRRLSCLIAGCVSDLGRISVGCVTGDRQRLKRGCPSIVIPVIHLSGALVNRLSTIPSVNLKVSHPPNKPTLNSQWESTPSTLYGATSILCRKTTAVQSRSRRLHTQKNTAKPCRICAPSWPRTT